MKTVKAILNRRALQLQAEDQVIVPAWARGKIVRVEDVKQDQGANAVRVEYAPGGPEPILYLPTYVLTVERLVPVAVVVPPEAP